MKRTRLRRRAPLRAKKPVVSSRSCPSGQVSISAKRASTRYRAAAKTGTITSPRSRTIFRPLEKPSDFRRAHA